MSSSSSDDLRNIFAGVPNMLDDALRIKVPDSLRHASDAIAAQRESNYASSFHEKLLQEINDFHASLDQDHEVGLRLVSFGQSISFHLEDIGYDNPSLIIFYGAMDDGQPVELIQHVSQISILLIKMKRLKPQEPKNPIGFRVDTKG